MWEEGRFFGDRWELFSASPPFLLLGAGTSQEGKGAFCGWWGGKLKSAGSLTIPVWGHLIQISA